MRRIIAPAIFSSNPASCFSRGFIRLANLSAATQARTAEMSPSLVAKCSECRLGEGGDVAGFTDGAESGTFCPVIDDALMRF